MTRDPAVTSRSDRARLGALVVVAGIPTLATGIVCLIQRFHERFARFRSRDMSPLPDADPAEDAHR